jgi:hypothetical protein
MIDVNNPRPQPAWDLDAFGETPGELTFWSNTALFGGAGTGIIAQANMAATVYFGLGATEILERDTPGAVRCVSAGKVPDGLPSERYRVSASDGTVYDTRTELTWRLTPLLATPQWATSQGLCGQIDGGYRMPTYKELLTLVDSSTLFPATTSLLRGLDKFDVTWAGGTAGPLGGFGVLLFEGKGFPEQVIAARRQNPKFDPIYQVRCVR